MCRRRLCAMDGAWLVIDFDGVGTAPSPVQAGRSAARTNLPDSGKLAIIAALEREVRPLVKNWRIAKRQFEGRQFKFFERGRAVLVCGGIGAEAAHGAAEAVINIYHPVLIQSVGFAGALDSMMKVGNIFTPAQVIDGNDGGGIDVGSGTGTLLSVSTVAGVGQKAKFANDYGANAIDMEAAAVAHVAQSHGIQFQAVKSISDEYDFEMPPINRFIRPDGGFRSVSFAGFVAVRPWLWNKALRLARNSEQASRSLCEWLNDQQMNPEKLDYSDCPQHPIERERIARRLNR